MVDSHTKYHEICHFHHDVYKDYLLEEVAQRTPIGMNPSSIQLAATVKKIDGIRDCITVAQTSLSYWLPLTNPLIAYVCISDATLLCLLRHSLLLIDLM